MPSSGFQTCALDLKSTRLNSSHTIISYAVFCLEKNNLGNLDSSNFEEQAEALVAHPFHEPIEALEAYRYPAVAALNGHTIGGGLELALSCDILVASRGIKLGMPPAKLGLIYSHTGLRKFIEVCGLANTCELFYVGRNVDSERAARMGLVNQVV